MRDTWQEAGHEPYRVTAEEIAAELQVHMAEHYRGRALAQGGVILLDFSNGQHFLLRCEEIGRN